MRFLEPLSRGLRENRWCKGPEDFAMFDALVQYLFHLRPPRVGDYASIAERSRSPFRAALEPSENFPVGHNRSRTLHQMVLRELFHPPTVLWQAARVDRVPNLIARISRSPVGVIHDEGARLSENLVPHKKCSSYSQAAIACRRMNVHLLETRGIEDFAVGHAIKSHSPREAHRFQARALRKLFQHAKIDFLEPRLQ